MRFLLGKGSGNAWINSQPDSCGWMKLGDTAVAQCSVAKQSAVRRNNNVYLSGVPFFPQLGSSLLLPFHQLCSLKPFSGTRTGTISGITLLDFFASQ